MDKQLYQTGEFVLIEQLAKLVPAGSRVIRGIGDDAAVLDQGLSDYTLLATDALEEGVHFLRSEGARRIGRKALAVNLSDIAAMGGKPQWAVVCLGLPGDLSVDFSHELYQGMAQLAKEFKVGIVGGDTWRSKQGIVLTVTVLGRVSPDFCVYRDGAGIGESICLTGRLGDSSLGKHLDFIPRLEAGQVLAREFEATAMIDLSDGLFVDLGRLARASGVGARVDLGLIPVTERAPARSSSDFLKVVGAGEEFELLFTIPESGLNKLLEQFSARHGLEVTQIGITLPVQQGFSVILPDGKTGGWPQVGFDHFQSSNV